MKRKTILSYRRKTEGKTDYKQRLKLVLSNKVRLVIRKSLKNISAQIIEYNSKGDKVLVSAHTSELKRDYNYSYPKRNITTAYLLGLLIGTKAKKQGINSAILDISLYTSSKGSILYSVLKGAVDAGLKIPHSEDIFPDDSRIKGSHLKNKIPLEDIKSKILEAKHVEKEKVTRK
ncbi:MAG: 50S ribosomal protein L18 [Candidatus Woesearchaeota archaeon]